MISVVILTKNEEKNIADCLESVKWADEIIIIDDNSEDGTIKLIQNLQVKNQNHNSKLKIYTRELNGDFAAQRNFGLEKASGDWVLFVDADERVTQELKEEIISVTTYKYPTTKGFYLYRKDFMWGKWIKHGDLPRQEGRRGLTRILRLGMKDAGSWKRPIHEVWEIKGDIGELTNPLIHLPHQTVSEFLEEINFYSTLRAKELFNEGKKTNLFEIIAYPSGKFLQNYFFRLGFLDGMPGFAVILLMSFHSFLVRSKLYLLWKQGGTWN